MCEDIELFRRRRGSRLLINDSDDSGKPGPIIGYAQEPLLPLDQACKPLVDIIHDILTYAAKALNHTPIEPADDLTRDESASIRLYTMEWIDEHKSLYFVLNHTLKSADRDKLQPWFKYLKLLLTALAKIPCTPLQTVWRGVRKNISDAFPPGEQVIWWSCSSCTTNLTVLKNKLYLGDQGDRTLFSIELFNGRSIRAHSQFDVEDEILMLPGTYMEVQSQFNPAPDLCVIHLKQKIPKQTLLELPFKDACIYPKISTEVLINSSKRRWYRKPRFFVSISLILVAFLIAIILGSIFGLRSTVKTTGHTSSIISWNGTNWAFACDFPGNDLSNVKVPAIDCGGKCASTSGCTHFTWTTANGGTCWMKNGSVSKNESVSTTDPTMVCGIAQPSQSGGNINWNANNWAFACDFLGNDLSNVEIPAADCGGKCASTSGCTHFTWTTANGGTCWMKNGSVSKHDAVSTTDSTMVCGIAQPIQPEGTINWNGNNWAFACDFLGNDLSNVQVPGADCGGKCASTSGCTHFTWTTANGGTCWMKNGSVSKNESVSTADPTMVCGIVQPSQPGGIINWNGNNWAMSCDFHGNDLSHVRIRGEDCSKKCASTSGCTHFTWTTANGGTCWMKKGSVSKHDAVSTTDPTMVCGIAQPIQPGGTIDWNGNNWAFACDFHGNDLSNARVPGADCGGKCASTPGCTHFTWTTANGGTCWMKKGSVSKHDAVSTTDSTMVCGVLTSRRRKKRNLLNDLLQYIHYNDETD